MKEISMKVNGMVCGGCENRVKNALCTIDGIEKVEANYQTGMVKVIAKQETLEAVIEEKITDIGFEVIK